MTDPQTDAQAEPARPEPAETSTTVAPRLDPLIEEAAKKAAIAWLTPGGAVWCLWVDGALYVVTGPGEQPAAGLAPGTATVTLRGDHGGRIVDWTAQVSTVPPGSQDWEAVAPQLAAKRLNLAAAEDTVARWASTCVVYRLTPTGATIALTDGSGAAEAPATTAARRTKSPFRLHRVKRPR
ncbi:hypothetical protein Lfu02_26870 [Longispora fulva]|uniref:Uncharacterized protein n=1 Tax=Longispora fulva TaxID=619741 RepID=A0A8J7GJP7_9ACTN|nr:hypothetical protein [Longispora fulva]MBG6138820.1 hypothetical protein [Longispora fulva]GIG58315.1 hypothetical protein Lfu02_26870 [Longispora fulva]